MHFNVGDRVKFFIMTTVVQQYGIVIDLTGAPLTITVRSNGVPLQVRHQDAAHMIKVGDRVRVTAPSLGTGPIFGFCVGIRSDPEDGLFIFQADQGGPMGGQIFLVAEFEGEVVGTGPTPEQDLDTAVRSLAALGGALNAATTVLDARKDDVIAAHEAVRTAHARVFPSSV